MKIPADGRPINKEDLLLEALLASQGWLVRLVEVLEASGATLEEVAQLANCIRWNNDVIDAAMGEAE
jgi:hypothetical protein